MEVQKNFISVYKRKLIYPKKDYKLLDKRSIHHRSLYSYSTILSEEKNKIILTVKENLEDLNSNTIIVCQSMQTEDEFITDQSKIYLKNVAEEKVNFEIFSLQRVWGTYQLYLNYSDNAMNIGLPFREDFHLLSLEKDKPSRLLINGYLESDETGMRKKIYIEQEYYIEFHGLKKIEIIKEPHVGLKKTISLSDASTINLRRLFY